MFLGIYSNNLMYTSIVMPKFSKYSALKCQSMQLVLLEISFCNVGKVVHR